MVNYKETKIFMIYNDVNDKIYINYTTRKLYLVLTMLKYYIKNKKSCIHFKDLVKLNGNFNIKLIESYSCKSKEEVNNRIKYWKNIYKDRLMTDYNRMISKDYNKLYYEKNKKSIKKIYSEKIKCKCGAIITKWHLARHLKTKFHIQNTPKE